jgi:hypothetical protein
MLFLILRKTSISGTVIGGDFGKDDGTVHLIMTEDGFTIVISHSFILTWTGVGETIIGTTIGMDTDGNMNVFLTTASMITGGPGVTPDIGRVKEPGVFRAINLDHRFRDRNKDVKGNSSITRDPRFKDNHKGHRLHHKGHRLHHKDHRFSSLSNKDNLKFSNLRNSSHRFSSLSNKDNLKFNNLRNGNHRFSSLSNKDNLRFSSHNNSNKNHRFSSHRNSSLRSSNLNNSNSRNSLRFSSHNTLSLKGNLKEGR